MSVLLSAWNDPASAGRIFMKLDTCVFFKYVEKIQVSLKSDKNDGYLEEEVFTFITISR